MFRLNHCKLGIDSLETAQGAYGENLPKFNWYMHSSNKPLSPLPSPFRLVDMSIDEFWLWAQKPLDPFVVIIRMKLWKLRIAIGNGSFEEQIIRLMVTVSQWLEHTSTHSGLSTPLRILLDGRAWCDQISIVFGHFAYHFLGVITRQLHLIHTDLTQGHFVTEVYYGNAWHLFDPHPDHLSVYRFSHSKDIMSFDAISHMPAIVDAECNWFVGVNGEGKSGFFKLSPVGVLYCWEYEMPPFNYTQKMIYDDK